MTSAGSLERKAPRDLPTRLAVDGDDLTRAQSVGTAIRRAFPLPDSGAFSDLLAALDFEPQG